MPGVGGGDGEPVLEAGARDLMLLSCAVQGRCARRRIAVLNCSGRAEESFHAIE